MGINIPTREELIANKLDAPQLAASVGEEEICDMHFILIHMRCST